MKTRLTILTVLIALAGCASYVKKEDLRAYVPINGDIARACLKQCGTNKMVTAWGSVNNQLKCECAETKTAKK